MERKAINRDEDSTPRRRKTTLADKRRGNKDCTLGYQVLADIMFNDKKNLPKR